MPAFAYTLTNRRHGVLYVGVTTDLARRVSQHRSGTVPGFTKTYNLRRLVWFEQHDRLDEARARERSLKRWRRAWKISMVEELNPDWRDLSLVLNGR